MTARAGEPRPSGPLVIRESLQGKYAGFASRFTAFAVDVGVSLGVFMLALAAVSFAAKVLTGKDIAWNRGDIWVVIAYAAWGFIYFAYSWAASGRTAGMALFGVRVVTDDGTDASGRRAVVRTLALPLSFLFPGLGFAGILLGGRRRALHDVIAGTRSSTPGTRGQRGCGTCPGADPAAASCGCRFFIRPGQAAARVSRRRSRWGSGCLLA